MIIDFHTHYYPEKIVAKAMASVQGLMTPAINGGRNDLLQSMQKNQVDISVLLPLVNTPANCMGVNTWAKNESRDGIIALGSIHPADPDVMEHLDMLHDMGFAGLKVHPEYQNFKFDEERYFPVWERCAELGFFILTHCGFDIKFSAPFKTDPEGLAAFHHRFPELKLVLAHLGGLKMYDEVEKFLVGEDVFLDLAFIGPEEITAERLTKIIRRHGADKILFGSDSPWYGQADGIAFVKSLDLTEEEKNRIFSGNARKLLKLN